MSTFIRKIEGRSLNYCFAQAREAIKPMKPVNGKEAYAIYSSYIQNKGDFAKWMAQHEADHGGMTGSEGVKSKSHYKNAKSIVRRLRIAVALNWFGFSWEEAFELSHNQHEYKIPKWEEVARRIIKDYQIKNFN